MESNQRPLRVLIVDDHALIANGIQTLIESYADGSLWQVIGHAGNGLEAYEECRRHEPDLILMDLGLPDMGGVEVIGRIRKRWPEMRILCISAHMEQSRLRDAIQAGALGYVLKRSSQQVVLNALRDVSAGRHFIDPEFGIDLAELTSRDEFESSFGLTAREKQLLKLISGGLRNKDIAEQLNISVKTVMNHRLNLMRKLGANNVTELVHWALRLEL